VVAAVYLTVVALSHTPVLALLEAAVMEELRLHHRGQLVPAAMVTLIQAVVVVGALITLVPQTIKDLVVQAVPA
jgi:hypothetical protein